jgi:hypothetical protein
LPIFSILLLRVPSSLFGLQIEKRNLLDLVLSLEPILGLRNGRGVLWLHLLDFSFIITLFRSDALCISFRGPAGLFRLGAF